MKEYNNLLDNLQALYDSDNAEELFRTLGFISGLMLEDNKSLKTANLRKTDVHGRLSVSIIYAPYDDNKGK